MFSNHHHAHGRSGFSDVYRNGRVSGRIERCCVFYHSESYVNDICKRYFNNNWLDWYSFYFHIHIMSKIYYLTLDMYMHAYICHMFKSSNFYWFQRLNWDYSYFSLLSFNIISAISAVLFVKYLFSYPCITSKYIVNDYLYICRRTVVIKCLSRGYTIRIQVYSPFHGPSVGQ